MECVDICNRVFREISPSLFLYRMITDKQIDLDINVLLDDYNYFELMYVTLIAWNMNTKITFPLCQEKP